MDQATDATPAGAQPTDGVVHKRSPIPVAETVDRLVEAIQAAGAKLFLVVDHSGEAELVGLRLRDTKLLIFGNPAAGTPAMVTSPLAALDLPLKVLVWADDDGVVWMSYLFSGVAGCPPQARRHGGRPAGGGGQAHRPGRRAVNGPSGISPGRGWAIKECNSRRTDFLLASL